MRQREEEVLRLIPIGNEERIKKACFAKQEDKTKLNWFLYTCACRLYGERGIFQAAFAHAKKEGEG